jgi:hypothetical protein
MDNVLSALSLFVHDHMTSMTRTMTWKQHEVSWSGYPSYNKHNSSRFSTCSCSYVGGWKNCFLALEGEGGVTTTIYNMYERRPRKGTKRVMVRV